MGRTFDGLGGLSGVGKAHADAKEGGPCIHTSKVVISPPFGGLHAVHAPDQAPAAAAQQLPALGEGSEESEMYRTPPSSQDDEAEAGVEAESVVDLSVDEIGSDAGASSLGMHACWPCCQQSRGGSFSSKMPAVGGDRF